MTSCRLPRAHRLLMKELIEGDTLFGLLTVNLWLSVF